MIKYPHVELVEHDKFVCPMVFQHPELENCLYVIQEKLHGSNFRIHITPDSVKYGSRESEFDERGSFFNFQSALPNIAPVISAFKEYPPKTKHSITLFGEIIGKGVQKGVDYNTPEGERRIRFFDMAIDDQLLTPAMFELMFDNFGLNEWRVPFLGTAHGLEEAVAWNETFLTTLKPEEGNIAEGIVIKPYFYVIIDKQGRAFMLKKKAEKWKEKAKEKRVIKEQLNHRISPLLPYITENRINSVFSKHGKMLDRKDTKKYLDFIVDDAIEDFEEESSEILDNGDKKQAVALAGKLLTKMWGK